MLMTKTRIKYIKREFINICQIIMVKTISEVVKMIEKCKNCNKTT